MNVELIYDHDCPNIPHARANLVKALAASGREARWTEWDRSAVDSPSHVRGYGSPTILVDGEDVAGCPASDGSPSCRLYGNVKGGFEGAPSVEAIRAVLELNMATPHIAERAPVGWRSSAAAVPGIAVAFLPKLACPACWPAYAGLLSSVGLGFLLDEAYLLPLTAAFLFMAVGALAFRAAKRRGYGPFVLGLAAALIVLAGKFTFGLNAAMYGGIAVLVSASVWNAWPVCGKTAECPACVLDPSSKVSSVFQKEIAS